MWFYFRTVFSFHRHYFYKMTQNRQEQTVIELKGCASYSFIIQVIDITFHKAYTYKPSGLILDNEK